MFTQLYQEKTMILYWKKKSDTCLYTTPTIKINNGPTLNGSIVE